MQRKIYVDAESKASLKRKIKNNFNSIVGTEYNAFSPDGYETNHRLSDLSDPTIIAIYDGKKNSSEEERFLVCRIAIFAK